MIQDIIGKSVIQTNRENLEKLEEHTKKIKNKIESGKAIDKGIIDREAIKELNHKEAHEKTKIAKKIEHKVTTDSTLVEFQLVEVSTIIIDIATHSYDIDSIIARVSTKFSHIYILCNRGDLNSVARVCSGWDKISNIFQYIHTFKYSSKSNSPKIGYKEHFEYIVYINIGNKPVNHLLPNVIESTYARDSRNLGFYTNILLRSANAGDTILGINIINGNLIKAAQAMLCSTIIVPSNDIAKKECEKTIRELQFK